MTGLLTSLKAASPDAVIGFVLPERFDYSICPQPAKSDYGKVPVSGNRADRAVLAGKVREISMASSPSAIGVRTRRGWPKARPFFEAYKAKFNELPDYLDSVSSFMSAEILQQAVEKSGSTTQNTRGHRRQHVRHNQRAGSFQRRRNVGTPNGYLQIQKGIAQIVWPDQMKTSNFEPKGPWK